MQWHDSKKFASGSASKWMTLLADSTTDRMTALAEKRSEGLTNLRRNLEVITGEVRKQLIAYNTLRCSCTHFHYGMFEDT